MLLRELPVLFAKWSLYERLGPFTKYGPLREAVAPYKKYFPMSSADFKG
jgi:hypothetical protein